MASRKKVEEIVRKAGYTPMENRAIVVTYAPANLSDQIARFFSNEFYVLQMCENSLILIPFGKLMLDLKKEVALEIPYDRIHGVEIRENMLNYRIELDTEDGQIALSAQQKELSEFRSSGTLAAGISGLNTGIGGAGFLKEDNWHRTNLDGTLEALKKLAY